MKKQTNGYSYFFVKPKTHGDVQKVAKKLIGLDKVKEVVVTEGAFGFIVKSNLLYEEDQEEMKQGDRKSLWRSLMCCQVPLQVQ